jgi:SPP1 gp7 family putative phage head morphogenesis protein
VLTSDRRRETKRQQQAFARARRAEQKYSRQLRKVATQVGNIINSFPPGDPAALPPLTRALAHYAEAIRPWATAVASDMVAQVARYDELAWRAHTQGMARAVRQEIAQAPTGAVVRRLLAEQVALITSLPIDAGNRVHKLTTEALVDSSRASEIAKDILRSGEVTRSRATLIARTEVGRTSTAMTQARAEHMGSDGYIWRTAGDADVRKSHKQMEGKFVRWDTMPRLSDGTVTHAGAIWNCRCFAEPVIPAIFDE